MNQIENDGSGYIIQPTKCRLRKATALYNISIAKLFVNIQKSIQMEIQFTLMEKNLKTIQFRNIEKET